jgi:hypothetical protein
VTDVLTKAYLKCLHTRFLTGDTVSLKGIMKHTAYCVQTAWNILNAVAHVQYIPHQGAWDTLH